MQADPGGLGLVKEEGRHGLAHIVAQLFPGIPLGEDVVREALGHEAAIPLLGHIEHDFHAPTMTPGQIAGKPSPALAAVAVCYLVVPMPSLSITPLSFEPNLQAQDGLPHSSGEEPLNEKLRTINHQTHSTRG